jgi:hypothetical protein
MAPVIDDPYSITPLTFWEAMPPHKAIQISAERSGWVGHGIVTERLPLVLYSLPWMVFWFLCRYLAQKYLFPSIARRAGLHSKVKTRKFCYQMWLLTYYTTSACIAGWGLWDEPWFKLPMDDKSGVDILFPAYQWPNQFIEFLYQFQLGFYLAELIAIFIEPKRSDFVEYVIHHTTTIFLVAFSSLALETRVGAYVFFIHDVPDIFLCAAKSLHYLGDKWEIVVNTCFALFVASFIFGRLVCLPSLTYRLFTVAPLMHVGSYSYWALSIVLGFVLQALHIFWFVLIARMIVRLIVNEKKGDVRSDDDEDEAPKPQQVAGRASVTAAPAAAGKKKSKKE